MNPRRTRGMTLVELLVALTLIALLSVGLFETFRLSQRLYSQLTRQSADVSEILATHRVIRRLIGSAYPPDLSRPIDDVNPPGITYRNGALEIVAPHLNGTAVGMHRYRLTMQARSDATYDVLIRDETTPDSTSDLLLSRVASVKWAFLPQENGQHGVWQPEWMNPTDLPLLVRMEVGFSAGDRRRWPLLIVHPHVAANAQCEFDVIARSCRRLRT